MNSKTHGQNKDKNVKTLLYNAKYRAKKSGQPFNLSLEDIVVPELCPILDIKFSDGMYAPSLDKIIPEDGYVKGNVRVITRKANVMKNNATFKELSKFSHNILDYMFNSIHL